MSTITTKDGTQINYKDWGQRAAGLAALVEALDLSKAIHVGHSTGGGEVAGGPFYGANRPGPKVSQGLRDSFWLQSVMAETGFMKGLKAFDVPTLILHGEDDQIVPIGASAMLSSKLVRGATLEVYPGASHGMCSTPKDQINADLLAFSES